MKKSRGLFFLLFIFSFFLFTGNGLQILSDELSLEDEIKEAFKDYPFKCNPEGSTPEIAACSWIELIKSDRALKKELNNSKLFKSWVKARGEICNHFQNKMYSGGTIRQITRPNCAIRVNKEIQKYCITGDPTCG